MKDSCTAHFLTDYFNTFSLQATSSYYLQGLNMDLKFGGIQIPPAFLYVPEVLFVMVLIPFMDRIFYPLLLKYNIRVSSLQKIGTGMVFAALSMIVAAVIEKYRRDHVNGKLINEFHGKNYNASSMSVFYQLPQYILIGFSEVFTSVSGMNCYTLWQNKRGGMPPPPPPTHTLL